MKKITGFLLAAVMMLSAAGCSEKDNSSSQPENIAVQLPGDDSSGAGVSVPDSAGGDSSIADSSIPEEDILTPAVTEAQALARSQYSDYGLFIRGIDHSDPDSPMRYECEIVDNAVKQEIFESLCPVLKRNELSLEGEPYVKMEATTLTLKNSDGDEYRFTDGYAGYDYLTGDGTPALFLTAPHSEACFEVSEDEMYALGKLLTNAVKDAEKLPVSEGAETVGPTIPRDAETPEFPLTFISVRTNFAWGRHIGGSFLDSRGYMYYYDLSDDLEEGFWSGGFADALYKCLLDGKGGIRANGVSADTSLINEGLSYAAKIGPDTVFTEQHMMEDYGQQTVYAVVGGKPVMLVSRGDVDRISEDENVLSAISLYRKAFVK